MVFDNPDGRMTPFPWAQVWINSVCFETDQLFSTHISCHPSLSPFLTCSSGMSGISAPYSFVCVPVCEFFPNCMFGLTAIPASKHLKATYNVLNSGRLKGRCLNKMHIVEQLDMPGTAALKHSARHRSSDIAVWMGAYDRDKQGFGPGLLNFA